MSKVYTGVGTLADGKTVTLDRPTHLPPGRVRVIVEPLHKSGYRSRSKKEIDKQIRSERQSWEGRVCASVLIQRLSFI